jgi:hypothetical protein
MNKPIKPALSSEEWERAQNPRTDFNEATIVARPHARAALALIGRPFGFTREDVRMLRETARRDDEELRTGNNARTDIDSDALRNLADRIEALLPPESA